MIIEKQYKYYVGKSSNLTLSFFIKLIGFFYEKKNFDIVSCWFKEVSQVLIKRFIILLILLFSFKNAKSLSLEIQDSVSTWSAKSFNFAMTQKVDYKEMQFVKPVRRRVNFGLTGSEYYFILLKLFTSKNLPEEFLVIDNNSIDKIFIYKVHSSGTLELRYSAGQVLPFDMKNNLIWHTVHLELNDKPVYYLIVSQARQKNINIQYRLQNQNELFSDFESYDRIIFFFLGGSMMIAGVSLLAYFLFWEKVFAFYFGYTVCVSLWIVDHYGRLFPYFFPHTPILNEISKPLSSLGASLLLLTVIKIAFRNYLNNHSWMQFCFKALSYFLSILLGFVLLLLLNEASENLRGLIMILWHFGLFLSIGLIVFVPLFFIRKGIMARIFSVAMLVISLATVLQILANSAFVDNYFIGEHGMALGILLENSIMAFGLFNGLLIERKNNIRRLLVLEEKQSEILKNLVLVQDKERKRIAGDLHDNLGPLLASLKINFRRIMKINDRKQQSVLASKTEEIIDESITEIRSIAHDLVPKSLSTRGLIVSLEDYFDNIRQLYGKELVFNHQIQSIVGTELQVNIYRIISELVLNAAKHSKGSLINVWIFADDKNVLIKVEDNGEGFKYKKNDSYETLGIQSVEGRVEYMKGKFSLMSAIGNGTKLHIEIPL